MIPKELEKLKLWIRLFNHTLVDVQSDKDFKNSKFMSGARYVLKHLAHQYAYWVKEYRKQNDKS